MTQGGKAPEKMIRIGHFGILSESTLKDALGSLRWVMVELGATKAVQPAGRRRS